MIRAPRLLLLKSHVSAYTRKDGTFVVAHEDKRQKQVAVQHHRHPTESESFKNWFGDSKVVDADGKPKVMYHGTASDFSKFDPKLSRDIGSHFGTKEQASKFGNFVMPVYLSIKNPLRVEDRFSTLNGLGRFVNDIYYDVDMTSAESTKLFALAKTVQEKWSDDRDADNTKIAEFKRFWKLAEKILKRSGYDGLVYENKVEGKGDSYIAFDAKQIKSATGNSGAFSPKSGEITKSLVIVRADMVIK